MHLDKPSSYILMQFEALKEEKNSDPETSRIEHADMAEIDGYHLISAWEHQMRRVNPQRSL